MGKPGTNVVSGYDATASSYVWTVPEISDTKSGQCKIRVINENDTEIFDESDGVFTITPSDFITVVSPAEGDIWTVDSNKEISWQFKDIENVKIEISCDEGITWNEIAASVPALSGSYEWNVTGEPSDRCLIRLSDPSRPEINDTSALFKISESEVVILHNPMTEAHELQAIVFEAEVTGTSDIDAVYLYYRNIGNSDFNHQEEMTPAGENRYSFTLGSGYFTAPGLEYYIVARDIDDMEARSPADVGFYSVRAYVSVLSSGEDKKVPGGSAQNSYRMISIPLELDESSIESQIKEVWQLGSYETDWRLFRFPSGGTDYLEYPDIEGFEPGKAFWVITKADFIIKAPSGKMVTTDEPFEITLQPGWNDIANPWLFDIDWSESYIEFPSVSIDDLDIYTYEGEWSVPTVLEPWKGYAVYKHGASSAMIKLHPYAMGGSEKVAISRNTDIWKLALKASAGLARDSYNYLGVAQGAETGWDNRDQVEPPPVGDYVSVNFPHRDWIANPYDYTVDIRPPDSIISWNFTVKTNIPNETVNIDFEGIEKLPEGITIEIIDLDGGSTVNLANNAFDFVSLNGSTERHFRLIASSVSKPEEENDNSKPENYVTATLYPNPFNPQTTIHYELSIPGNVIISVYNAVGQKVRVYDAGYQDRGVHEHVITAHDLTSGLYFYRIDAGYACTTGKMLYLK